MPLKITELILITLVMPLKIIFAQVNINEIYTATSSDWVELINLSTQSAQLIGYKLEDGNGNSKQLEGELSSNQILSVSFRNYLNKDGDSIKLYNDSGLVEEIVYGNNGTICAPDESQSLGKKPDGTGQFLLLSKSTPDSSNNDVSNTSCPSPSPTNTQTPANSPKPTPTSTPKPTLKAASGNDPSVTTVISANSANNSDITKSSPTRLILKTTISIQKPSSFAGEVQGANNVSDKLNTDVSQSAVLGTRINKPLIKVLLFTGIGLSILTLASIWRQIKITKNVFNHE